MKYPARANSTEEQLKESERRLALHIENTPLGCVSWDLEFRCTEWNLSAEKIFGYSAAEAIGRKAAELIVPPAIHGQINDIYAQLLEQQGGSRSTNENLHKNGAVIVCDWYNTPIVDSAGDVTGVSSLIQDITDRKLAEDHLKREQLRLESILQTAADGIVIIDSKGVITSINPAAQAVFKYRSNEVLGKNVSMLMPQGAQRFHDQYISRYIETGVAKLIGKNRELTGLRSDGSEFPMQLSLSEWFHGEERYFTGVIRDVTEQKQVLAQLVQSQKIESLTQLSGGLAHDFNNLLAIVIGNLDILESELSLDDDNKTRLQAAIYAAERGADITERMLKLTRISEGAETAIEAQNVNQLLKEMVAIFHRTLGPTYHISIRAEEESIWVLLDPSEFENVILNLCLNARDAMPRGGEIELVTAIVPLKQTSGLRGDPKKQVQISLSDTGTGIAADVIDRVFEPFFSTKTGKGSGLGLAMAYSFAKSCRGSIAARSEPGHGTTIEITLPLADKPDETETPEEVKQMPRGRERILLVDDEPELLHLTEKHLRDLGYDVVTATSARRAESLLVESVRFDLLLTDVVMPGGMLGTDLARRARQLHPDLKVLLMSGFTDSDEQDSSTEKSFQLLKKPFRKVELANMVRQVLG